jgi:hypothetical protein
VVAGLPSPGRAHQVVDARQLPHVTASRLVPQPPSQVPAAQPPLHAQLDQPLRPGRSMISLHGSRRYPGYPYPPVSLLALCQCTTATGALRGVGRHNAAEPPAGKYGQPCSGPRSARPRPDPGVPAGDYREPQSVAGPQGRLPAIPPGADLDTRTLPLPRLLRVWRAAEQAKEARWEPHQPRSATDSTAPGARCASLTALKESSR